MDLNKECPGQKKIVIKYNCNNVSSLATTKQAHLYRKWIYLRI